MSTVAEQLRSARESKALSVQQVVEITKMRSDHVRALEEGDYGAFSAPVYIRGFVRTYASVLKLNVPEVMQQLEVDLANSGKLSEAHLQAHGSQGGVDKLMLFLSKVDWAKGGIVLLAVLALAALAFVFVYQSARKGRDPLAGEKPRLYQSPSNTGETLPLPGGAKR
jgi:cytoskeleton protein RodZ